MMNQINYVDEQETDFVIQHVKMTIKIQYV